MRKTTDLLQRFFELTGNDADSLIFLKNFRSIAPEKFLLIYVNTEVVLESFSSLFYDLNILYSLDLFPVILVSQDSISYIRLFFQGIFIQKSEIKENDLNCDIIPLTDSIENEIKSSIENKRIPFVVIDSEEKLFSSVAEITTKLLTNKFLYLSVKGSIKKIGTNDRISIINIRSDYPYISNENLISNEDKYLLDRMKYLLEKQIFHSMNIAITSPLTLLKELFTVNGSGTFIKLGSEILHVPNLQHLNIEKVIVLLESAFRKKIHPDFLESKMDSIFLESNYRGAAILKLNEFGALLSKFAVDEIARGEGIGRDIWNEMKRKHNTIFWRAKPNNPIHKWYSKECQGMDRGIDWNVYWINLEVENIPAVCRYLRNQTKDFIE
ncbi:MAG: hypothetical protein IPL26_03345 [Leptospiraceae bacterium]|nr:hypothetical protein [Leptospiraceae bacterium]